jgi:gluconokinase
MKDNMVHSQFTSLEEPRDDEADVLSVDVSCKLEDVQLKALNIVQKELSRDYEGTY